MSNSSAGPVSISYDVQDEVDAGFSHTAGSSEITLSDTGSYLVFANTGFRISGGNRHRQTITQRLALNQSFTSMLVLGSQNTLFLVDNLDPSSDLERGVPIQLPLLQLRPCLLC